MLRPVLKFPATFVLFLLSTTFAQAQGVHVDCFDEKTMRPVPCGGAPQPQPPPPDPKYLERKEKQRELKAQGMAALEEERYADAVKILKRALDEYGPDPEISTMLNEAIGDLDEQQADEAEKMEEVKTKILGDLSVKQSRNRTDLPLMKSAPQPAGSGLPLMKSTSFQGSSQKKLMNAIIAAGKSPKCTGKGKCNFFVGFIGKQLQIPYFQDVLTPSTPADHYLANKMYDFISKAVQSRPSGWKVVSEVEAQELANNGRFVIGVARNASLSPNNPGHIVVVAPSGPGQLPYDKDTDIGSEPWVRASNHSDLSVRANYAFCPQGSACSKEYPDDTTGKPIYAVWVDPKEGYN